jgi:hypothetical protein
VNQMAQKGFIKFNRTPDATELLKHPNEFTLLALIATRARRTTTFSADNLQPGEALIGDYRACGLSESRYRTAKKNLEKWKFITTQATNKGTIARLINSSVFDINANECDGQGHKPMTNGSRPNDGRVATNKNEKNERNKKKNHSIHDLQNAERVLQENGRKAFKNFCIERSISTDDMERILYKNRKSPSPSPSPKKKTSQTPSGNVLNKQSKHFSTKVGEHLKSIKENCKRIEKLPQKDRRFNPWAFVQQQADNKGHPQAIDETLQALVDYWQTTENPWSYARAIMKTKNGNFNERDYIKKSQRFKEIFISDPEIKKILQRVGNA